MPPPDPLPTHLYKILSEAPPSPLPGSLPLSDLDKKDGYIHLSTADQVASTADKWFSNYSTLWLLKIKYEVLARGEGARSAEDGGDGKAEIKWEEVGRGCFAHFYGGDLGKGNVDGVLEVRKGASWADSIELEW